MKSKYVLIYLFFYIVGLCGVNALPALFGIDLGQKANIGLVFIAAIFAIQRFLTDYKRVPVRKEIMQLVLGSFLATVVASCAFLVLLSGFSDIPLGTIYTDFVEKVSISVLLAVIAGVSLVYLACLYFVYGLLSPFFLKMIKDSQK